MLTFVLNAEQLACLSSPVRNEVFARLRLLRRASVRELAESLHRKPQAVHYHMHELMKVGLATEVSRRASVRKPEAVYEPVQGNIALPRGNDPKIVRLRAKAVSAGLRQTQREFTQAAENADPSSPKFHVLKMHVRLSGENAKRFIQMLEDASRFAKEHQDEECQALAWHSIVYPT